MKPRLFLVSLYLSIVILSCSKKDSATNTPPPPPPAPTDTLSAGWSKIVVSGFPTLIDIFFINNTGFATSGSSIYKSTDGGSHWIELLQSATTIANIGMGSETNAAFAVEPQKLVSTQDGGASFDTVTVSDNSVSDVFFVDSSTAYAVGNSFWKTTDAGLHWTKVYDFPSSGSGPYQTLYFLDQQTGWVMRNNLGLYKTVDGGVTWQSVNVGNQLKMNEASVVFFADSSHGFIADFSAVAGSTDGGLNWSKLLSASSNSYHDLHFVNDNVGYTTDGQYIKKTVDGGATWTKEAIVPGTTFYEVHFTDANHGWACGTAGVVLKFQQ